MMLSHLLIKSHPKNELYVSDDDDDGGDDHDVVCGDVYDDDRFFLLDKSGNMDQDMVEDDHKLHLFVESLILRMD
jgi:hypothetical protein